MVRIYINIPVLFLLLKKKTKNLVYFICMYSSPLVLNPQGTTHSLRGHLGMSGDIFDHHNSREGGGCC